MPFSVFNGAGTQAMHGAVVPIATATPSSASVTFSNIPQGYQDLFIVINGRSTKSGSTDVLDIQLNGDGGSGALYSHTRLYGDGSSASSARGSNNGAYYTDYYFVGNTATSGIFNSTEIHILNYANTSTYKTMLVRAADDQNGSGATTLSVGLWRNTNAISSIFLFPDNSSAFVAGTRISIYGVRTVNQ